MASEHFKAARGTTEPGQASPCSTDAPREAAETSQPEVKEAAPRRSTWLEQLQLRPSADPADDDPIVFLDASCGGSSAGRICMRLFDLLHWRAAEAVRARCEDGEGLLGRPISARCVEGGLELVAGGDGDDAEDQPAAPSLPTGSAALDASPAGVFVFANTVTGAGEPLRLRFLGGEEAPEERLPWAAVGDLLCGGDVLARLAGVEGPAPIVTCCGQSRGRGMNRGRPTTRVLEPDARQSAEEGGPSPGSNAGSTEGEGEGTGGKEAPDTGDKGSTQGSAGAELGPASTTDDKDGGASDAAPPVKAGSVSGFGSSGFGTKASGGAAGAGFGSASTTDDKDGGASDTATPVKAGSVSGFGGGGGFRTKASGGAAGAGFGSASTTDDKDGGASHAEPLASENAETAAQDEDEERLEASAGVSAAQQREARDDGEDGMVGLGNRGADGDRTGDAVEQEDEATPGEAEEGAASVEGAMDGADDALPASSSGGWGVGGTSLGAGGFGSSGFGDAAGTRLGSASMNNAGGFGADAFGGEDGGGGFGSLAGKFGSPFDGSGAAAGGNGGRSSFGFGGGGGFGTNAFGGGEEGEGFGSVARNNAMGGGDI